MCVSVCVCIRVSVFVCVQLCFHGPIGLCLRDCVYHVYLFMSLRVCAHLCVCVFTCVRLAP